jgi:hypothetical protein
VGALLLLEGQKAIGAVFGWLEVLWAHGKGGLDHHLLAIEPGHPW